MLSFDGVEDMAASEWFRQLPLFAIVSIISGLLGALFNALHKALLPVSPTVAALCRICVFKSVIYIAMQAFMDCNSAYRCQPSALCCGWNGRKSTCHGFGAAADKGAQTQRPSARGRERRSGCTNRGDHAWPQLLHGNLCGSAPVAGERLRLHPQLPCRYVCSKFLQAITCHYRHPIYRASYRIQPCSAALPPANMARGLCLA